MINQNKVAVISGGASGLALETSLSLAKKGVKIACLDINEETGRIAVEKLSQYTEAAFFKINLCNIDEIKDTIDRVAQHFGRIDYLLCAAAASKHLRVMDITEKDWDFYVNLDLKSQFFLSQACVPYMAKAGGGRIVHFSSIGGSVADGKHIMYGAAKAGLHSMVRELAVDLWKDNIQVNGIAPAYVITPFCVRHLDEPGWEERMLSLQLGPRMMVPEDIAKTVDFLCTCKTPAINGTVLIADSGFLSFRNK